MEWNVLAVRSAEDEDGRIYPLLGSGVAVYEPEPADGRVTPLQARALSLKEQVEGRSRQLVLIKDEDIDIFVTEGRVVISCARWNKGDRYWGTGLGATSALLSNIANSVKEARARRGQLLMGHIRLNWMAFVGCQGPQSFRGGELIRLVCYDGFSNAKRMLTLDLRLQRSSSAAHAANLIGANTANYLLRKPELTSDSQQELLQLARVAQPLVAVKGKMSVHKVPICQYVNYQTIWNIEATA